MSAILARLERRVVVRETDRLRSELVDLQRTLAYLPTTSGALVTAPVAELGSFSLGLSSSASAASISSSEQANTDSTTAGPESPAWQGLSSSDISLSGVYDGSQGVDTLTVEVTQTGVRGSSDAQLTVRDGGGSTLDTITVAALDPVSTVYTLSNGVALEFGNGVFVSADTFAIDVRDDLDFAVDPDAAFDGSGAGPAGLQRGEAIGAGSFAVNGTTIAVLAADSLNAVLARINASAAGVIADYDNESERVTLTQQSAGAEFDVALGSDSSGFLSAFKLNDGISTPGTSSDFDRTLSELPGFSSVTSGTALVNGAAVAIDPATDTLQQVLTRFNAAQSAATLELRSDQRVQLRGSGLGEVSIDSNGTGLFEALGLASDSYAPSETRQSGLSGLVTADLVNRTERIFTALNDLLQEPVRLASQSAAREQVLADFREAAREVLGTALFDPLVEAGVTIGADRPGRSGDFLGDLRSQSLAHGFSQRFDEVYRIYSDPSSREGGFVDQLLRALDESLGQSLPVGSLINLRV